MKKFLVALSFAVITTMFSSCFTAIGAIADAAAESQREKEAAKFAENYGDHPTVFVYGLVKYNAAVNCFSFAQLDSRLPPSVLKNYEQLSGGFLYYGEALCGATYKLIDEDLRQNGYNTIYITSYEAILNASTTFDFKVPKITGVYYLGMKNSKGEALFDDPDELKMREAALKKLTKEHKNSEWLPLLTEEYENVQAQLKK